MDGRSPNAGVGGRTQQAGTLVAATVMPITFQPTLMPRSAGRTDPARVDRHAWRRASVGLDVAAVAAGLAIQRALRARPGERLPRGGGGAHGRLVAGRHRPVGGGRRRAPGVDRPPG